VTGYVSDGESKQIIFSFKAARVSASLKFAILSGDYGAKRAAPVSTSHLPN